MTRTLRKISVHDFSAWRYNMPSVLSRPEEPIEEFEERSASEYEDDEEEVKIRVTDSMDADEDDDEVPAEDMDDIDAESAFDMDELTEGEEEVFDAPMSSEEILSSVLATPEGDTVCSALVNIGHHLEITNKILIKMLKHMTQE